MRRVVVTVVFFGALLLAWQIAASSGLWMPVLLPGPGAVASYLERAALDGSLLEGVVVTARRLVVGYAIGLLVGIPLGCLTARYKTCAETLGMVALGLQTLPSVCWVPLALLWFGQTEGAMLFIVVMGSTWSIQIATDDGLRAIPPIYLRAARTMGSSGLHAIVRVLVPASLPALLSGMKQGWAFAWRSLMAAEVFITIITGFGLGSLLHHGRELLAMDQVVGVMIVIIGFGLVVDRVIFAPAERWLRRRWGTLG